MANSESAEVCYKPLYLIFQSDFSSVAMTRSGLSLEELRIVEGQGQNSDVTTPPEEINRMNELGKQEIGIWRTSGKFVTLSVSHRKEF